MKDRIFIIDGSSYLYRAYHAMPPLSTSSGQPTGAVKGVTNMLMNLKKDSEGSPIIVVFDAKGKTFRNEIYSEYKANRPPMPDDLRDQLKPVKSICRAIGFPLIEIEGVEADDVIGWRTKFNEPLIGGWKPPKFGNINQTMTFLESEASKGDPRAQFALAELLSANMWGQSTSEGIDKWLELAAAQDYPRALGALAIRFAHGFLSELNEDAFEVFVNRITEAAYKGDPTSQLILMSVYYKSSHSVGNPFPQTEIETEYYPGLSVYRLFERDLEKAYYWQLIYSQNKRGLFEHAQEHLKTKLTPSEIDRATESASSWGVTHHPGNVYGKGKWPRGYSIVISLISTLSAIFLFYLAF